MPPKAVNALQGIDVLRISQISAAKAAASAVERTPEKKVETKTALVLRKSGGVKKSWKETAMTLDANYLGNCTFSDGGDICVRQAMVEVPWVYEDRVGQKFHFSITDVAKTKAQESLLAPNAAELDKWLNVLEGHGAIVHRPLKMGSMSFLNNKKKEDGWFVLYSDGLQLYKQKADSKPTKVISIAEANELERFNDGFMLAESGDDMANSLTCTCAIADAGAWCDVIEQAVVSKRRNKYFNSIKEGYLNKCNADMKFWKKRYCVLMSDHIKYFKKRFDEQPAGTIQLPPGAEAEDVDDSFDAAHPNMFWVAADGDETGTRRYSLTASSPKEKEQWLAELLNLLARMNYRQHPSSIKEGYLYHLASGTTNLKSGKWNKQFFVLLKDTLLYFKKRADVQPQGSIDLKQGAAFDMLDVGAEASPNERFAMTIAENGDEQGTPTHFLRAPDETIRKQWALAVQDLLRETDARVHMMSVKEGYMFKQNTHQKWNKRYFILLDNKLSYYKRRQDKSEAGEIPLLGSGEITCINGEDPNYKWMFTVAESGDEVGVRTFYVACATETLRTQWVNVLTKIIKAKDTRILMGSFLEGYLWKCPEGGGAWRKRYFVLKQNQLLYFRKRTDPSFAGCIEVKGEAQVTTIDDDPEHPYSFSVAKNGDEGEREVKIYAPDATTRDEWVRCLRQQVNLLAVKTKADSLREGYVNLWTALGWRRKFFVLDKELKLFGKRHDQNPSSVFVLDDQTVVLLQDSKTQSPGSSIEQKPDQPEEEDKKVEEKKPDGELGEEDAAFNSDDAKATGASILLCKNGDQNARRVRLKIIYDSEANFVADAMTVCIGKEFPPKDTCVLKSGYLAVRQKATGLAKADRWVSSYVTLTTDDLFVFRSRDDEFPIFSANVDIGAMFYAGPVPGMASWNPLCMTLRDATEREISFMAQSVEEKSSWMSAVLRSIEMFKEKKRPSRVDLFGGDLKTAFIKSCYYGLPNVVTPCLDFLHKTPVSYCLLRMPGFHPLVRSVIQDFECSLDVALSDPESVASCLRIYLTLLKKPIILDPIAQSLFAILVKCKAPSPALDKEVIQQFQHALSSLDSESTTTLTVLLRYLAHEIKRPEEVHLSPERVAAVWSPLLIRYKEEGSEQNAADLSQQVLVVLLRNLESFYPGEFILVHKYSRRQLQKLKAEIGNTLNYEVLRGCPLGKELFGRFVKENHIEEDVLFLAAVQQYKEVCDNPENTHVRRLARGLAIFAQFVKQGAETQVNVADATSKLILERFEGKSALKQLSGSEFFEAEGQAVLLINTNSWPRFKQSEAYEHWITYREQLKQRLLGKPVEEPDALGSPTSGGNFSDFGRDHSPNVTPRGSPRHSLVEVEAEEPPPPPPDDDPVVLPTNAPPNSQPNTPADSQKPLIKSASFDQSAAPLEPKSPPPVPKRQAPVGRAPTRANLLPSVVNLNDTGNSPGSAVSSVNISLSAAESSPAALNDLPPPPPASEDVWFVRKTTKGVPYYIHTVTKSTTYTAPDALIYSSFVDESGTTCFLNNKNSLVEKDVPECLREFALTYKLR